MPQPHIPPPHDIRLPGGAPSPVGFVRSISHAESTSGYTVRPLPLKKLIEIDDIILVDSSNRPLNPWGVQLTNHEAQMIYDNQDYIRDNEPGTNYPPTT